MSRSLLWNTVHFDISKYFSCVFVVVQRGCRGSQGKAGEAQFPVFVPLWQLTLRCLLDPVDGAQQRPARAPPPPTCGCSAEGKWTTSGLSPVPSGLHHSGAVQDPRAPHHSQIQLQEYVWANTPDPHGPCPDQGLSDCVGLKVNPCPDSHPYPPPQPCTHFPKAKTPP